MSERQDLLQAIEHIQDHDFESLALRVFRYQAQYNLVYQKFLQFLKIPVGEVDSLRKIPFLPIEMFKQHQVQSQNWTPQLIFSSSGTSSQRKSQHLVRDIAFYARHSIRTFEQFYGSLEDYTVLALLPSYLERTGSSLVYMVEQFIQASTKKYSGFFLYNTQKLAQLLGELDKKGESVLLLGVTYALLDFAEEYPQDLHNVVVMETGGMKGRRKEMVKSAVHKKLENAFCLEAIHSEYGMTELLSQAYSKGKGVFEPAPSMHVLVRDPSDPLYMLGTGQTGGLCIIDLANLDSCSFIATDDLGRVHPNGTFEVLGRFDASDLRGCNLLIGE
ncbi:MAG: acyl transferase [Saprospiraceae bacterium]|nr:acyl transferase [Saprospiraceae bacterium]